MRYPADHKAQTRDRILQAAAKVFRRRGFAAAGVDEVMAEASLTAGGFYSHFKSKDELLAATIERALQTGTIIRGRADEGFAGAELVRRILAKYLSPQHRQALEKGCVMPPLLAELARQKPQARAKFEAQLLDVVATLVPHLQAAEDDESRALRPPKNDTAAEDHALAMLATMIGGMTLARAVADETLADRILAACRELAQPSSVDDEKPARTRPVTKKRAKKHSPPRSSNVSPRNSGAKKR